jgi:hypothetical protein
MLFIVKGWMVYALQTIFYLRIPKKRLSQASLLISTKKKKNISKTEL